MKPSPSLTLEQLQQAFAEWRQTRQPRSVPTELRHHALALAQAHGTATVLRTLALSHSVLARWKQKYRATPPTQRDFVALPAAPEIHTQGIPVAACALRLTLRREPQGLVLSGELSLPQWREALSLLEAER